MLWIERQRPCETDRCFAADRGCALPNFAEGIANSGTAGRPTTAGSITVWLTAVVVLLHLPPVTWPRVVGQRLPRHSTCLRRSRFEVTGWQAGGLDAMDLVYARLGEV